MLFPKKPVQADAVDMSAELVTATSKILELTNQVAELQGQVANYQLMEKLNAKASALDFTGDVNALFLENNGDYTATLEAMIEGRVDAKTSERVEANSEEFLKPNATNPAVGSGDDEENEKPTSRSEAIAQIRTVENCSLREATTKARTQFPNLFK